MTWEYLIFNSIIVSGPLALSFEKGVNYLSKWGYAFASIFLALIPFIIWDALVTGRHWWFNDLYITGIKILGLPLEEWMFFITVPFAVLFIWEIMITKTGNPVNSGLSFINTLFLLMIIPAGIFLLAGKEYTAIAFLVLAVSGSLDLILKTQILARPNTYIYLTIVFLLNMIFNGYLTSRPIVLYDAAYQMNFRIFTIPFEDILYGFGLILINTILYEKFKEWWNDK
jgi:lycopene cyclase domain-containing protein